MTLTEAQDKLRRAYLDLKAVNDEFDFTDGEDTEAQEHLDDALESLDMFFGAYGDIDIDYSDA